MSTDPSGADEGRTGAIRVTPDLSIDASELEFRFVRASGPGGQNVNKVATAVQLRFDAARCRALSEAVLARLRRLAGRRMTADGVIVIEAKRHRTQDRNRADALERLADLLARAARPHRPRRPTRPGVAARKARLADKRHRAAVKRTRRRADDAD